MLLFPGQRRSEPFRPGGAAARVAELAALVERARPDLPPEAPERRGAVLLLLIPEAGFNVDRLVLRTGFPREFVAQCLRRLVDNAWWVDGAPPENWCADPLSCRDFWLDVDVALGRRLRRVDEHGRPEWAAVGEWVKEFEYYGPQAEEDAVHTGYREIPPHNPEVVPSRDEAEEPARSEETAGTRRAPKPATRHPSGAAEARDPRDKGGTGEGAAPSSGPPTTDPLLDSWVGADWLR